MLRQGLAKLNRDPICLDLPRNSAGFHSFSPTGFLHLVPFTMIELMVKKLRTVFINLIKHRVILQG